LEGSLPREAVFLEKYNGATKVAPYAEFQLTPSHGVGCAGDKTVDSRRRSG
jgi:hypothetical protein